MIMPYKPNFVRKPKRKVHGEAFWDKEYKNPTHLKLSSLPSSDLEKFTRWLARERPEILEGQPAVLDVGCGNGRNLIFLARELNMVGVGYDIAKAAIAEALLNSKGLPLRYEARSIAGDLKQESESFDLVLDMMTSHFLKAEERLLLREEMYRVLKPGGQLFIKTFLKDGDLHTKRLIGERPGKEEGSYIHPVMGVAEYVYSEEELVNFLGERFKISKIYRSHKHAFRGQARKRRTITIYAEKPYR